MNGIVVLLGNAMGISRVLEACQELSVELRL